MFQTQFQTVQTAPGNEEALIFLLLKGILVICSSLPSFLHFSLLFKVVGSHSQESIIQYVHRETHGEMGYSVCGVAVCSSTDTWDGWILYVGVLFLGIVQLAFS
jgi:hypothetical protein